MDNQLPQARRNLGDDGLQNLWQTQPCEPSAMSIDEIRLKADTFRKRIGRRNRREYIAGAAVVLVFTGYMLFLPGQLVKIGSATCVAAGIFVTWYLYRKGSPGPAPTDMAVSSGIAFHRKELERERDLLRTFWLWNLAPFVPGLAVTLAGLLPDVRYLIPALILNIGVFAFFWQRNARSARKLQREIDDLSSLEE